MPSIEEIEYQLRKATDEVSGLSHALVAACDTELAHMDRTDCELRNMVINLHTEIQDLKVRLSEKDELISTQRTLLEDKKFHRSIHALKDEVSARDQLIDEINNATKMSKSCSDYMQLIDDLLDEWMNPDEEPEISGGDSVSIRVAFLELP